VTIADDIAKIDALDPDDADRIVVSMSEPDIRVVFKGEHAEMFLMLCRLAKACEKPDDHTMPRFAVVNLPRHKPRQDLRGRLRDQTDFERWARV
jgi:hypothetical protein